MKRASQTEIILERLLSRWGGAYLLRIPSITQLISFPGALIGIAFILTTAQLSRIQVIELLVSVFSLVTLVNLIMPFYTLLATKNARAILDVIFKNKPLASMPPQETIASLAWQELNDFPRRYIFLEATTAYFLVVLPVVLFMRWVGGVDVLQTIYIAVGGGVSATAVVIQNSLFLEIAIGPARNAIFERRLFQLREIKSKRGLRYRLQGIVIVLILMAFAITGVDEFTKGDLNFYGLTFPFISMFVYLIQILVHHFIFPIQKSVETLEQFSQGEHAARVPVLSSDETQELTIRLNKFLDQLQVSQTELEEEIKQRTRDLNLKTTRWQAAALIARDAASARDTQTLLSRAVKLISEHFGFYHSGIFLLDSTGEYAILQAASSEGGQRMLEHGHRLIVGEQGIVGTAAYHNQPRVIADVEQDSTYYRNLELPFTKSEAAIPLSARGKVIGVLDVQSTEKAAFSQDDIELLQTLADQIALAIHNAQLIEESQETLAKLQALLEENVKQVWRRQSLLQKSGYRYTPAGTTALSSRETPVTQNTDSLEGKKLFIPIRLRGQTIGKLTLTRKSEADWSDADQALLEEIAAQVGLAMENSRLLAETQERAFQEQLLSELTSQLSRSIDSDALLQTTARQLHGMPNVAEVAIFLTTESAPEEEKKNPEEPTVGGS